MDSDAVVGRHQADDNAIHVDKDTFKFLLWPYGVESWLWASGLNGSTAVTIISKSAGILWHFDSQSPRGHAVERTAYPGTEYFEWVTKNITDLYLQNDQLFNNAELFIAASQAPGTVHLGIPVDGLINKLKTDLRLPTIVITYPIHTNKESRPPLCSLLEVQAWGNNTLPKLYFNGEPVAGYTYHPLDDPDVGCRTRYWNPTQSSGI